MRYKFMEHTADVKFQARGNTIEKAFENSALALKDTMTGEKIKVKEIQKEKIKAKGKDFESLLYSYLEQLLYMLEAGDFLFSKVKSIKINKKTFRLTAVAFGDKASNYRFVNPVKAITYNEMFVNKSKTGWKTQVVLDV
jgi:SHS2 domain-containing protein